MKQVRSWLQSLRNEKQLTMKQMGELLNISESYYSQIESTERQKKMDVTLVAKLAEVLGVTVECIISHETNQTPPPLPPASAQPEGVGA